MRILQTYLVRDYLVAFFLTLLIFTFVMSVGAVVKAIDLLSRGVSGYLIFQVFLNNIPYTLTFSIPMSALTAVLLQFGRLSIDGEITAMKSCGLSIWQIISGIVVLSIVLSGVCIFINNYLSPNARYAKRTVLVGSGVEEPVNLLEEGRFVRDFPGMLVYVGKKDRQSLKDIVVYELGVVGVKRYVRAKSGTVEVDHDKHFLLIDLYDVRIDQPDQEFPMDPSRTHHISAQKYPVKLDFSEFVNTGRVRKKDKDMTLPELINAIKNIKAHYPDLEPTDLLQHRMSMLVEANKRVALSLSCFAFTILGIPLGLKSKRKESSVGVGISLILVFFFYLFIIIAEACKGHPAWHPELIVWLPVIISEVLGFYLLKRIV